MRNACLAIFALLLSVSPAALAQHTITTVAGFGWPNNVPALAVGIAAPNSVYGDSGGNLYTAVSDVIYKVGSSGQITVVAGNGGNGFNGDGGPATNAELNNPFGVFVDSSGNIFIADYGNHRIREVVAATGNIQTVAGNGTGGFNGDGGPAITAALAGPTGVFVDGSDNIFIADNGNQRIREVVATTGNIQTIAGNGTAGFSGDGGPATGAELSNPFRISVDHSGNIFISDLGNNRIRKVVGATSTIQTVAGNGTGGFSGDGGPATSAELSDPTDVFVDGSGNIFIADDLNNRIREVVAATGNIQTVAGNGTGGFSGDGGPATSASLATAIGVFVDSSENIFIAASGNNRVREVVAATGNIQTVAGNGTGGFNGDGGPATGTQLDNPTSVSVDSSGNIFIADESNVRIREVVAATGTIRTVAGNGTGGFTGDGGLATNAEISAALGLFVDRSGNIFIADTGNNRIREVLAATGIIQTVAGNGTRGFSGDGGAATNAEINLPYGVLVDGSGNIFISDNGNYRIREVVAATGNIQTVAGNGTPGFSGDGGPATSASLATAIGVFVDGFGNIFIADTVNSRIREVVAATGVIQTVAGNGTRGFSGDGGSATSAELASPEGVLVDGSGNIFIADAGNSRIREVVAATGIIETVAGNGAPGFSGDGGPAIKAELLDPIAVADDHMGNLLISDVAENRIRSVAGLLTLPVSLSPSAFSFANQLIGTTSGSQQVVLTNSSNTQLNITSVAITGTNPSDFALASGTTCTSGAIIASHASCVVNATFTPGAATLRNASVTVTDSANTSPQLLPLSGAGTDFSLGTASGGSNSATVTAGQPATYNLQVNPIDGFTGSVTVACTGSPTQATCAATTTPINVSGPGPAAFTINVTTTSRTMAPLGGVGHLRQPAQELRVFGSIVLFLLLIGVYAVFSKGRMKRRWAPAAILLGCLAVQVGCSGGGKTGGGGVSGGTPAGPYTLTVTGTQQGASRSMNLSLNVN